MKRFFSRSWLAAGLLLAAGLGPADAGSCGPAGCGVGGAGIADSGHAGYGYNDAWLYPYGGFTPYPGEPGSCVPSHSDYSKVNWTVPATESAQMTLDRLRALGVPLVTPDTIYLGKNPHAAEVKLPIPKGWTPKEVEPMKAEPEKAEPKKAEPKKGEPEKLEVKPKVEDKTGDE